uniref:Uncharacterized protein n=1 Tax=Octopus bimaculoides TaxID=37653 RepID=A0A0L8IGR6_OCTBM
MLCVCVMMQTKMFITVNQLFKKDMILCIHTHAHTHTHTHNRLSFHSLSFLSFFDTFEINYIFIL